MARPLAEIILALNFPDADAARIDELNTKANEGLLTEAEAAELGAYVNIGDLLAYWQSKARQVLQRQAARRGRRSREPRTGLLAMQSHKGTEPYRDRPGNRRDQSPIPSAK